MTIKEASKWASEYLGRNITESNINYLVQYARVKKHLDDSNNILVSKDELKKYYDKLKEKKERWENKLKEKLNWDLSFDHLKESERTKHVHRLHPYKGKFIPQLVRYFLDNHVNKFKEKVFFRPGNIIVDPFLGSGTAVVVCTELGVDSIGIEISKFNCMISEAKVTEYDLEEVESILKKHLKETIVFSNLLLGVNIDEEIKRRMSEFNNEHFPSPEFKARVRRGEIEEKTYSKEKLKIFLESNKKLLNKLEDLDKEIKVEKFKDSKFISKWFSNRILRELSFYIGLMENEKPEIQRLMKIIISRTGRSCRSTTHIDLVTLKKPVIKPYYCIKHKKICMPVNSIIRHLRRYTLDTIKRLKKYSLVRKKTNFIILHGDSKNIDIFEEVKKRNKVFYKKLKENKIDGLFTSPPYIGQIDYHEQHAYAYELFGISRKDEKEIGRKSKGKSQEARKKYIEDISQVLRNISRFVKDDGYFFIVANDKLGLYPKIARKANLKIVKTFKRPVLNRTERDRQPYAESIFLMVKS